MSTCEETLQVLILNLNDQETVTGEITKAIAQCFQLWILDLTGCKGIDEVGIGNLSKGFILPKDKEYGEKPIIIGL